MARPTAYARQKNFTDYAVSNPSAPYNAADHDTELNTILASINQTITFLNGITRDDGKLLNKSVTVDTLADSLYAFLTAIRQPSQYAGDWEAGKAFVFADVITDGLITYFCVVPHTSTVLATDVDNGKWLAFGVSPSVVNGAAEAAASAAAALASENAAEAAQIAAELAETNAETAELNTQNLFDNFDTRYLGDKASDPTLNNSGNPLADGALYYNTTTKKMRVYDLGTTAWDDAFVPSAEFVAQTSLTGSAKLPAGTTAERDDPADEGWIRFNRDVKKAELYNGSGWSGVGGGATGGGQDEAFVENDNLITESYVIGQGAQKSGVTVDAGTNVFSLTGHGFTENQLVFFMTEGTLPAPLEQYVGYYVIASGLTADAFKLSETLGGAEINITDTGTGAYTVGKVKNAISAGTMVTADGVTVTIPSGAFYTTV